MYMKIINVTFVYNTARILVASFLYAGSPTLWRQTISLKRLKIEKKRYKAELNGIE